MLTVDVNSPTWHKRLDAGVSAIRWIATDEDGQRVPIVAVQMQRGAERIQPLVTDGFRPKNPLTQLRPGALAITTGGLFRQWSKARATPVGSVVIRKQPLVGLARWTPVLAVDDTGQLRHTRIRLAFDVRIGGAAIDVSGLGTPLEDTAANEVLAGTWTRSIPASTEASTIVIRNSTVVRKAQPSTPIRLRSADWVLRTSDRQLLAQVTLGMKATLSMRVVAKDGLPILHAAGHLGVALKGTHAVQLCSEYEQLKRPRSLIAWNEDGTVWFIVAGTTRPDSPTGLRLGGTTKTQIAQFAQELGATAAVAMDGGGSSILAVREGSQAVRLDSDPESFVRPLPLVWSLMN